MNRSRKFLVASSGYSNKFGVRTAHIPDVNDKPLCKARGNLEPTWLSPDQIHGPFSVCSNCTVTGSNYADTHAIHIWAWDATAPLVTQGGGYER